jgi:hypothetical protein
MPLARSQHRPFCQLITGDTPAPLASLVLQPLHAVGTRWDRVPDIAQTNLSVIQRAYGYLARFKTAGSPHSRRLGLVAALLASNNFAQVVDIVAVGCPVSSALHGRP